MTDDREPKKITEVWAWVCEEEDGGEGIPAFGQGQLMMPLVMADRERIEAMEDIAIHLQKLSGRPFKLIRFHQMEVVKRLE